MYAITLVHAVADGWLVAELVSCGLSWRYSNKHRVPLIPSTKKQPEDAAGAAENKAKTE